MRKYKEVIFILPLIAVSLVEMFFVKSFHYRVIYIFLTAIPVVMYLGILEHLLRDDIKTKYPILTKKYPELLYMSLYVVFKRMNKEELPAELELMIKRFKRRVIVVRLWLVFQVFYLLF